MGRDPSTADKDEFVGPTATTLFPFGSQGCSDALDICVGGNCHHLGVQHGAMGHDLDACWKLLKIRFCHLLG